MGKPFEELACIRGKGLDIAALGLGVEGIKGQRRFSGTGWTCHHHETSGREIEIDVLEVM
jgi:hypothetical protein